MRALAISFEPVSRLADFADELDVPIMLASDPQREAYRAYGLTSGRFWQIWGTQTLAAYLRLLFRGRRLKIPRRGDDLSQLGGDFVLGPRRADEGRTLWYARPSHHPADRPSAAELLEAIDRAAHSLG